MCKNCGDMSKLHEELLKPKEGEQFSINANNLTDSDVININKFITFTRSVTKIEKLKIK